MSIVKRILGRSYTHLPAEKWDFNKVIDLIIKCREEDHGIPLFRTRYADSPIYYNNSRAVVFVCFGGNNKVKSKAFYDVPKDIIDNMESSVGDWKWLIAKSNIPEELKIKLVKKYFIIR